MAITATERLYFSDAYLREFNARVIARVSQGGRYLVALDRSAFYPEGGGQPADTGMLNDIAVVDVQSDQDIVWHALAAPLDHDDVRGSIDWTRRFDHMQQHHGQHLLSAAFEHLGGLRTVSFHLGAQVVTIDLAAAALTQAQAGAAEELVNQVIWENRPINARFVAPEELATIRLRKPPSVQGAIRVVSVPDFDNSACGGTHPHATGSVGIMSIRRWERRGDTMRVEFACGQRAARDLREKHAIVSRLANNLSVGVEELEQALQRLRSSEDQQRRALADARAQLLGYQAQALLAEAQDIGGMRVVQLVSDQYSLDEARMLARLIAEQNALALIGLNTDNGHVLVARGTKRGDNLNVAAILRDALTPLGGRGGGRPEQAQGGLPDRALVPAALEAIVAQIRQALA